MDLKIEENMKNGITLKRGKRKKGKNFIHQTFKSIQLNKKSTLFLLLIVTLLLQWIKIWIGNELTVNDYEYAYLLDQTRKQIQENIILKDEILKDEAFTTIVDEEKGFKPATFIYLKP